MSRTFTLSDNTASELWTALNESTGTPTPPQPPAPPVAPPGGSEVETIMAGTEYTPPAGGWPPRSAHQDGRPGTLWLATGSRGQGYYIDNLEPAHPAPTAGITPWPYSGAGLYVVIMESGGASQAMRTAAEHALGQLVGPAPNPQRYYAANFQADPDWNSAVSQVISGTSVDQVIANLQAQGTTFAFNAAQLAAAKAVADGL